MDHTIAPPRWDVTDVFPSLSSPAFAFAHEALDADVGRLVALYDELGIGAVVPGPPSAADRAALDQVLTATNAAMSAHQRLRVYATAHLATDSRDAVAQAVASQLQRAEATLRQLSARLAAWVAARGASALAAEPGTAGAEHAYALARLEARATHQMAPADEALYAELALTGSTAWARLHKDVTSQLEATVRWPDGRIESLPMPAVRGLASHPDPIVRRAAHEAELAVWPTVGVPLAAALSAIKGEAIAVNDRRGWRAPLDASLFANAVDRPTFESMQAAVVDSLRAFRAWLAVKARLLGHSGPLPWWDLLAPLPDDGGDQVAWPDGTATVTAAFAGYSPGLAGLAERAVREQWVDAESRPGKEGGAFCAPLEGDRSIVLLNWAGTTDSVRTLAHELGHAYHFALLSPRTPLQRHLTMALAETASIFCETLVAEASLAGVAGKARLALLDTDLRQATHIVVDIHSRFLFETAVFARRRQSSLGPGELCELMLDAQRQSYGDAVDPATLHPWMWAAKPHYYSSHFYNWPYTFGLLFGLGLHARYRDDPERFRAGYDDLLSATGLGDAADLAARFGIDVRDPAFWRSSLDVLRDRMDEYARLAADLGR